MHPKLLVNRERTNQIYCRCGAAAGFTGFHFHSHIELYLVEEGEVDVRVNQQHRRLHKGELAVILSYDAHQYEPAPNTVITYLIVPARICSELDGKSVGNPFISDERLFASVLQCCRVIAQGRNALLTDGCIRAAFGLLLETLSFTPREASSESDGLSSVLLYLHNNFRTGITLASTASALGYNPSYLSRHFKNTLGVPFNQYLTMLRLREAVMHLASGHKIAFCAYESGFHSVRTFYRAFAQEFGCTPGEYASENASAFTQPLGTL